MNLYASQSHSYDSKYESTIDSVINYIINEWEFSKTSCNETESHLDKPANAEFAKIIKKNWESKKTNENLKSNFEKYKSPGNCIFVPPKVNLELWKLVFVSRQSTLSGQRINLTNKLGSRPINKHSYSRNRSYAGNKEYYKQSSFFNCYLTAPRPTLGHY